MFLSRCVLAALALTGLLSLGPGCVDLTLFEQVRNQCNWVHFPAVGLPVCIVVALTFCVFVVQTLSCASYQ